MPGYSVLFPPLAAVLGPRLVGALSAVAAAVALRAPRARPRRRARRGAVVRRGDGHDPHHGAADLRAGRRRRARRRCSPPRAGATGWACVLAALSSLASPVARRLRGAGGRGLVAGPPALVAGGAGGLRGGARGRAGRRLPRGRQLPVRRHRASGPALAAAIAVGLVIPRDARVRAHRHRALRRGDRRELRAGDADGRQRRAPRRALRRARCSPPSCGARTGARSPCWRCRSLYWQWVAPVDDWARAAGDASVHERYYDGLLGFLATRAAAPSGWRSRSPTTTGSRAGSRRTCRWRAAGSARSTASATRSSMTDVRSPPARYRRWLDDNAVRFVALADAPIDYSAAREAQLVRDGLPVPARGLARRALARVRGRRRAAAGRAAPRARPRSSPSACGCRPTVPARSTCACASRRTGGSPPGAAASRQGPAAGRGCASSAPGPWCSRPRSPSGGCVRRRRDARAEGPAEAR